MTNQWHLSRQRCQFEDASRNGRTPRCPGTLRFGTPHPLSKSFRSSVASRPQWKLPSWLGQRQRSTNTDRATEANVQSAVFLWSLEISTQSYRGVAPYAPSSGLLCDAMLLLKDAPWYASLRAKCTSKLGALLGLWPGQSFNLNPATTSRLWCNATLGTEKNTAMMHLLEAIAELLPWENSKLMSVVQVDHIKYQPNSAPCCRVLVPRNDSVVPAGILESMPGGDLPKRCHSETLQEDGPQGNLVREPFWYHCKPLEFLRSEANLTTTPLEPLRAWICRSYWQDAVGTWRCPVAVAVTWNDLATLWYFTRLNSAQIGQVDCFFAAGCIGPVSSSVLRIFLRILFRTWDVFTLSGTFYPQVQTFSIHEKFHRCGSNRTMGPSTLRSAKSLSLAMNYEPISEHGHFL